MSRLEKSGKGGDTAETAWSFDTNLKRRSKTMDMCRSGSEKRSIFADTGSGV
jgi:hypothetical protein